MRFLALFIFSLFCLKTQAQNLYSFNNYNYMRGVYNPASIGTDAKIQADFVYTNQWSKIDGAPQTLAFSGSYDIDEDMAVGLNFYHDQIGLYKAISFQGQYAYRFLVRERQYFALGLGLGGNNISWNLSEARLTDVGDPTFSTSYNKFTFNASFGLFYRTPRFYVGASIPQLLSTSLNGSEQGFKLKRLETYVTIGHHFPIGEKFLLNPSAQFKIQANTPLQGEIQIRNLISYIVGVTVGYRTSNALVFGIDGMIAKKVRIGYMANYGVGQLANTRGFSHEVYLGLGFPYYFNKNYTKIINRKGGFGRMYKKKARHMHYR
ncbi:MAG: type IX secretion system membrane protein PorP/SprF [Bacteroidia bacterium]|nr:MAG: type IX secretion system membrane protein PorP/SprF [Bacteroidia bacterium]